LDEISIINKFVILSGSEGSLFWAGKKILRFAQKDRLNCDEQSEKERRMLRLRVVQAEFGDCLILEYGTAANPHYILIDGGPEGTYPKHLRGELQALRQSAKGLDLVVLSHVDNDHVIGLLELMAEQVNNREAGKPELIAFNTLWHNAFGETVGAQSNLAGQVDTRAASYAPAFAMMPSANAVIFGIREGNQLQEAQQELGIARNPGFPGGVITTGAAPQPVAFKNLKLWVAGPTAANLERLRVEWAEWLQKAAHAAAFADPVEADKVDRSVPNLSSIMLLAVSGRRKILLTSDGLGNDLIDGLKQAGLLDAHGKLHVSILKLPHHGSVRNVNRTFFDTITADTYVISANGKYNNPDLATLIWLVEAARQQRRKITIAATNETESTHQLLVEYPPAEYGYRLALMGAGQHAMVL
jgi:beta-lactamase superfamily II metal-dependent hydrolase